MKWKRMTGLLCCLLCVLVLLAGCGGKGADSAAADNGYGSDWDMTMSESQEMNAFPGSLVGGSDGSGMSADLQNRKVIRTASLSLESTEFDAAITSLEQRVQEMGGWVESSEIWGSKTSARNGQYTLRIPAEKYEEFLTGAEDIGNVLSISRSSDEITNQYYDTQARLNSLKTQEERLLAILEKADSLESIIELENALSDVRYQIESLTSTMRLYDSQVEMSTITVSIREVKVTTPGNPDSLGQRISQQFKSSLYGLVNFGENVLVFLLGNLPVLLIWAAVLVAVFFLGRSIWRRKKPVDGKVTPRDPKDEP